jgi:hypothetical protein
LIILSLLERPPGSASPVVEDVVADPTVPLPRA